MSFRTAASETFVLASVVGAADFLRNHVQVGFDTSDPGHVKIVLDIRLKAGAQATVHA